MSLFRLLLLGLVLLVTTLTAASLWIYLRNTQDYLNQQLGVHALDTATSLGLSLSPVLANDDWILAGSMVDAIFDRGEYATLELRDMEGEVRQVRRGQKLGEDTPDWFRAAFPLKAPVMTSEITGHWTLVARLSVQASPARAQDHLWQLTRQALIMAGLLVVVAIAVGALVLGRILKPLASARRQADGIRKRHFLRQAQLPWIHELRSLVLAMNQMVANSEAQFKEQYQRIERLRNQTMLDPDTGLGNLVRARQRLEQQLKNRELDGGMLVRVHLVGLDKVELKQGVDGETSLLQAVAQQLSQGCLSLPQARAYRIGFADFLLLLPGARPVAMGPKGQALQQALQDLVRQHGAQKVLMVATPYRLDEDPQVLESALDNLLSQALAMEGEPGLLMDQGDHSEVETQDQQLARLERVLAEPPRLLYQSVKDHDDQELYREVLARFHDGEEWLSPGPVMVMVARQLKHRELDLLVLDALLHRLPPAQEGVRLALNLTAESVLDPDFLAQLKARVGICWARLAFEVPERAYLAAPDTTVAFIQALQAAGGSVWLDHTTPSGLPLLQQHGLEGIKLDPAYTHKLTEGGSDMVAMMVSAAHSRGFKVVAEQVEQPGLARFLLELGVDGVQGFGVHRPEPLGE